MDTFVIATHNQKKLAELQRILEPLGISAVTAELEEVDKWETFAENAFLRWTAACKQTGKPAVADDSGLVVDALDAMGYILPGMQGRMLRIRIGLPSFSGNRSLIQLRSAPPGLYRLFAVFFQTVLFCGQRATCEGRIGFSPAGDGGFGYDPVFFAGSSFAELSAEEKDTISHRGKALQTFAKILKEYYLQIK